MSGGNSDNRFLLFVESKQDVYDVVVVGAGLAGLRASHKLLSGNEPKLKVLIIEAANRIGKKILLHV